MHFVCRPDCVDEHPSARKRARHVLHDSINIRSTPGPTVFAAIDANDALALRTALCVDPTGALRYKKGLQALPYAIAHGIPLDVIHVLLLAGAPVNAWSPGPGHRWLPLHAAAAAGNRPLAQLLLSYGADPGIATSSGLLPHQLHANTHQLLLDALRFWNDLREVP